MVKRLLALGVMGEIAAFKALKAIIFVVTFTSRHMLHKKGSIGQ
jgi:hypothetical protein